MTEQEADLPRRAIKGGKWIFAFQITEKFLMNLFSNFNHSFIPETLFFRDVDILICACYFTPRLKNIKNVSSIYDLSPLIVPTFPTEFHKKFSKTVETAIKRSFRILTISENSKKDLGEHFHLPAEQIEVIYPAAEEFFKPLTDREIEPVRSKFGIPKEMREKGLEQSKKYSFEKSARKLLISSKKSNEDSLCHS